MTLFQRLAATLVAGLWLCSAPAAMAGVDDEVFNKEGVWGIDVDHGACALSRVLPDGSTFLFRALDGGVLFGFFSRTPIKAGRAGRLELDAGGYDFEPSFTEDNRTLFFNGEFTERAVTSLRAASKLRLLLDGQEVVAMDLTGTGFPDALDGVIACSKGKSGWWGQGVKPAAERD